MPGQSNWLLGLPWFCAPGDFFNALHEHGGVRGFREARVLVTHDSDFLRLHARGVSHAGIAYCPVGARTIGQLIYTLVMVYEVMTSTRSQAK